MANQKPQHREGETAKMLEQQTAKISSGIFLYASSEEKEPIGRKIYLHVCFLYKRKPAIGPLFLTMGLYNKLVKTIGSDAEKKKPKFT